MTLHIPITHILVIFEYATNYLGTPGTKQTMKIEFLVFFFFSMNQLLPSDFHVEPIPYAKVKPTKIQTMSVHSRD